MATCAIGSVSPIVCSNSIATGSWRLARHVFATPNPGAVRVTRGDAIRVRAHPLGPPSILASTGRSIGGVELLERAYAAFNARDIEAALALMADDVDWPNGMEGGRVSGRDAVREYWRRQFTLIDSHVEPKGFTKAEDGRVAVDVHQTVRDPHGVVLSEGRVTHVYTLRDDRVVRMDIVART